MLTTLSGSQFLFSYSLVCLFILNRLSIISYFWKRFIIVLRCSCLSLSFFSNSFSCYFGNFCSPLMLSLFLLSQAILNCPSIRRQTIFKSIVWVGFGWERLEGILCIIRLHFVLASKQISLFTVDHQMMIYTGCSL